MLFQADAEKRIMLSKVSITLSELGAKKGTRKAAEMKNPIRHAGPLPEK
jgi:hypothetical protein